MRLFLFAFLVLGVACGDDSSATPETGVDAATEAGAEVGVDAGIDAALEMAVDAGPQTPRERLSFGGPFAIGFSTLNVSYTAIDESGSRELEVDVWYPAADGAEGGFAEYALRNSTSAVVDAPAADGSFPTFVFSHGNQVPADVSSLLMEHLASHGMVVIAPGHTGNTSILADRDTAIYYHRPADVSAALTAVLDDGRLGASAGTPRIVGGHSFGGYTALAVGGASYDTTFIREGCESGDLDKPICTDLDDEDVALFQAGFYDDRFSAVVAMAPGDADLFGEGTSTLQLPLFHMVAENDGAPRGESANDTIWANAPGVNDLRWNLLQSDHNAFTDTCLGLIRLRCSDEIEPELEVEYIRTYLLAYLVARVITTPESAEAEAVLTASDAQVELATSEDRPSEE